MRLDPWERKSHATAPLILEARSDGTPTPSQQSEDYIGASLGTEYKAQQSYLGGILVSYGKAGSVRPDFVSADGSVSWEVKNYNIATNSSGLINNVANQAIARAIQMPNTTQNVAIDTTGQSVSETQVSVIRNGIAAKSNDIIGPAQIKFFVRK